MNYSIHPLFLYARYIIGDRWYEAEWVMTISPEYIYKYASNVMRHRWPEAEKYISGTSWAVMYKSEFG